MHRNFRHIQVSGNFCFAFLADPTLLLLHDGQTRHHGRTLLPLRILRHFTRKTRLGCFGNHRSISPNTMSMVADHGNRVGNHVPTGQLVISRQVGKARRTNFQAIGLVGTIADHVNTKLSFGMLDSRIDSPSGTRRQLNSLKW